MPELPEVETVARSLRPHVLNRVLEAVWTSGFSLRQPVDRDALHGLCGTRITLLERSGKYLLFSFSNGRTLISHLGMSGRYTVGPPDLPIEPHTHLRFRFASKLDVRYIDPRRFGLAVVRETGHLPEIDELGPDPLSPVFTPEHLKQVLGTSDRDLKSLLLDQTRIAGLGNIYVTEALFHAGLRPTRKGSSLSRAILLRLHTAVRNTIEEAVHRRGTTLSDGGYQDADGQTGDNQHHLMVYSREGLPCRTCGSQIRRITQAQRSTYYCPACQR